MIFPTVTLSQSQLESLFLRRGPGLCLKGNRLKSSADVGLSFGSEAQFCLHFPGRSSLSIPRQAHEISGRSEPAYEMYENASPAIKSTRRLAAA